MPTELENAYLAGLLDGEGHIGIMLAKQRANGEWRTHAMIVTLANTHLETLRWAQSLWPHGRLVIRNQATQRVPIGNVRWSSYGAATILKALWPYLQIKTEQASLALQFAEEMAQRICRNKAVTETEWNRREDLRIAISLLNRAYVTPVRSPFPIQRYEHACLHCGKTFVLVSGSRRKFCDKKCYRKAVLQRTKGALIVAP